MPVAYPELPGAVIIDATAPKEHLNAEVWRHAGLAQERNLALVVEVYARSVLASRRLTEWWRSGDALAAETLAGIYLLRVDLQAFGPEAILRLTPYAAVGAPVFVGWNPIGQVCGRTQFDVLTPEAMALPLSAFVEDVLANRPHSLNPTPSLGSAERTREAAALRRIGHAWLRSQVTHSATAPRQASEVPQSRLPNPAPSLPEVESLQEAGSPLAAPPAEGGQSTARSTASQDGEGRRSAAESPAPPAGAAKRETSGEHAADPLDSVLSNARERFTALEDETGVRLDLQLTSLNGIDTWLTGQTEEDRLDFAKRFGAVVAVYVGETIRRRAQADWIWDEASSSPLGKLVLEGSVLGSPLRSAPGEWVLATLSDSSRSLFGQALAWCRLV